MTKSFVLSAVRRYGPTTKADIVGSTKNTDQTGKPENQLIEEENNMATSKDLIPCEDKGKEYFRVAGTPKFGISIEFLTKLIDPTRTRWTEARLIELLGRCDKGEGRPELEPIFYGKWRLVEDMAIVDNDAVFHILNYLVERTFSPFAYYHLDMMRRHQLGLTKRTISKEEIDQYRQKILAMPKSERDN